MNERADLLLREAERQLFRGWDFSWIAGRITSDAWPWDHGFDVFGTANFFNFVPLAAGIELLTGFGIEGIGRYVDQLVEQILDGLDRERYRLVSSAEARSSLVVFQPFSESSDAVARRLAARDIYVARRRGRIRVSPHLYNSPADIERVLGQL